MEKSFNELALGTNYKKFQTEYLYYHYHFLNSMYFDIGPNFCVQLRKTTIKSRKSISSLIELKNRRHKFIIFFQNLVLTQMLSFSLKVSLLKPLMYVFVKKFVCRTLNKVFYLVLNYTLLVKTVNVIPENIRKHLHEFLVNYTLFS